VTDLVVSWIDVLFLSLAWRCDLPITFTGQCQTSCLCII
jgi:hypothetical protein